MFAETHPYAAFREAFTLPQRMKSATQTAIDTFTYEWPTLAQGQLFPTPELGQATYLLNQVNINEQMVRTVNLTMSESISDLVFAGSTFAWTAKQTGTFGPITNNVTTRVDALYTVPSGALTEDGKIRSEITIIHRTNQPAWEMTVNSKWEGTKLMGEYDEGWLTGQFLQLASGARKLDSAAYYKVRLATTRSTTACRSAWSSTGSHSQRLGGVDESGRRGQAVGGHRGPAGAGRHQR